MPQNKANTAGGAFLGSILEQLAQQDADRQKQMLFDLQVDREKRLTKGQDLNNQLAQEKLASDKEMRATNAEVAKMKMAADKQAAGIKLGETMKVGQDVSEETYGALPDNLREQQLASTQRQGSVETGLKQSSSPGFRHYTGTAEQQGMEELLNNPAINPALRQGYRAGVVDKATLGKSLEPEEMTGVYSADPKSGKINKTGEVPKGAHFINQPQPSASISIANSAPDDAVDFAAEIFLQTNVIPGSRGQAFAQRVINRASQLSKERGGVNPVTNQADLRSDQAAQTRLQSQFDNVMAFKNTAKKNINVLKQTLKALPDSGSAILNRPYRWAMRELASDPRMAQFTTALGTVQPEIARILNSANLSGVNTVHAQAEVEKMLSQDYTVGQMLASLDVLERDMTNRETETAGQLATIKARIAARGPGATPNPARPNDPVPVETEEQKIVRIREAFKKARGQ